MKDTGYYIIYGWMLNKLKLKGTALQIFAVIYGFSKDGEGECSGSLTYLAETTGCTKQTVLNGLIKLEKLGYICKKQTRDSDGGLRNHYNVNLALISNEVENTATHNKKSNYSHTVEKFVESCGKTVETTSERSKNFTHEVKKIQCPRSKNFNEGSQKFRPNNNIREYIDDDYIERGKISRKNNYGKFENIFLSDDEYNKLLLDYGELLPITMFNLSSYMASTGKKYKNHYATLVRWCEQDKCNPKIQKRLDEYRTKDDLSEYKSLVNVFW